MAHQEAWDSFNAPNEVVRINESIVDEVMRLTPYTEMREVFAKETGAHVGAYSPY